MRMLLVGPDLEENLSLGYLASALRAAGHEFVLSSFNTHKDTEKVLREVEAVDVVGLSLTYQAKAREYLWICQEIKKRRSDITVVCGGHFASCAASELLRHYPEIDIIVIHEGEQVVVELANRWPHFGDEPESVRGIAFRNGAGIVITPARQKVDDIDTLTPPVRGAKPYLLAGVPTAYLIGSRGCLHSCTYCCISTLHRLAPGRALRQRTTGNLAAEMADLYHSHGVRHFVFHDDNFLVPSASANLQRLESLKSETARRGVTGFGMTIKCCPGDVNIPVFRALKDMGLVRVFLGIESASDSLLASFHRHQSLRDAEKALDLCRGLGISVQFNIMVFNPEASFQSVARDVAFMKAHADLPLNFCRTEIFAGTPLEKRLIEEGRTLGDYLGKTYRLEDPSLDLACRFFSRIFYERCWSKSSLHLATVSMEHLAAILDFHYDSGATRQLARRIRDFVARANVDSLSLLEELISRTRDAGDPAGSAFIADMRRFVDREKASRLSFMAEAERLQRDLRNAIFSALGLEQRNEGRLRTRDAPGKIARHAQAAILALGIASLAACQPIVNFGVSEYAPPPLRDTDSDDLFDKYETSVFQTDPTKVDTDGDGVLDGDEDHDGDGITNRQYQDAHLSPYGFE